MLNENDVHVWYTRLKDVPEGMLDAYLQLMSPDELERHQRFRHKPSQFSHGVGRALVRTVLSQYCDIAPDAWRFAKGEHGKPEIIQPPLPLRFNLSHTNHYLACAVALTMDVGVDIEHTERSNDVRQIADRYFSANEVRDLFALPFAQQADRFFHYWTLKEAYMKARGEGISLGLGNFSFSFGQEKVISLSVNEKIREQPKQWHFSVYQPALDHRMALAVKQVQSDATLNIRCFSGVPLGESCALPWQTIELPRLA